MSSERDLIYAVNFAYSQMRDEEVAAGKREYTPLDTEWGIVVTNIGAAFGATVKVENDKESASGLEQ